MSYTQLNRTLVDCPHCEAKQVWVRHIPFCKQNPDRRNGNANDSRRNPICPRCKEKPKHGRNYCKPCKSELRRLDPKGPERARRGSRRRREEQRRQVYAIYGDKCACCGETDRFFLTLDHVNNDGASARKANKLTDHNYRRVIDGSARDQFQLLCLNCNRGRWACGECPHIIRARGEEPKFVGKTGTRLGVPNLALRIPGRVYVMDLTG